MDNSPQLGKILIVTGALLVVVGLLVAVAGKIPWLGRLPGDIRIERNGLTFHLPLTTCLAISVALSLIAWLLARFRG